MNRIREERYKKKLTLKETVTELKRRGLISITSDTLSKYERGDREPKIETWQKLADFFKVSIPYIQGLTYTTDELIKIIHQFYFEKSKTERQDTFKWHFTKTINMYIRMTSKDPVPKRLYSSDAKKFPLTNNMRKYWLTHFEKILKTEKLQNMNKGDLKSVLFTFMSAVDDATPFLNESDLTSLGEFYKKNYLYDEDELHKKAFDKISYYDLASARAAINDYYEFIKKIKNMVDNYKKDDSDENTYKYVEKIALYDPEFSADYIPQDDKYIAKIMDKVKKGDTKLRDFIINMDYEPDLLEIYRNYLLENNEHDADFENYLDKKYDIKRDRNKNTTN